MEGSIEPHHVGSGPCVCIGQAFADLEGVLVLATLAQKWRARLVLDAPLRFQPLITLGSLIRFR